MTVIRHIARGMHLVTREAVTVRTIVAAGMAVAVVLPEQRGVGLLHLANSLHGTLPQLRRQQLVVQVRDFIDELQALGPLLGARAEVVGGADVLGVLPRRDREETARDVAYQIAALLRDAGMGVGVSFVGGRESRTLTADAKTGDVGVVATIGSFREPTPLRTAVDGCVSWEGKPVPVHIGKMVVAQSPHRLQALLGSCVGLALYDRLTKVGGLAHVMLPTNPDPTTDRPRFADTAVSALAEAIVAAGGYRRNLVAKIAGGASVMFGDSGSNFLQLPERNIAITRAELEAAAIPLIFADVGGRTGRRITVDLASFEVTVAMLRGNQGG